VTRTVFIAASLARPADLADIHPMIGLLRPMLRQMDGVNKIGLLMVARLVRSSGNS
jgi:hypothetical protein